MEDLSYLNNPQRKDSRDSDMVPSLLQRWIHVKPNLLSKFCAELSACAIFHFIGSVSATPWANGIALMVLVYYTAKTSGAHLNPALSMTFTLLGHTNPIEMLVYWIAQFSGCIIGALWIAALVPDLGIGANGINDPYSGCFTPSPKLSKINIFYWEAFSTFCFILPIFSVVWYTIHKEGYGNTGPLMVGLSLIANALAAGPFTGAALNPARVLASPAVFKCDNSVIPYYVAGEMLGAALVPIIIAPWYGISQDAWYLSIVSSKAKKIFEKVQVTQLAVVTPIECEILQALYENRFEKNDNVSNVNSGDIHVKNFISADTSQQLKPHSPKGDAISPSTRKSIDNRLSPFLRQLYEANALKKSCDMTEFYSNVNYSNTHSPV
jgi:glycerol uptake facilitator-like aquaporin